VSLSFGVSMAATAMLRSCCEDDESVIQAVLHHGATTHCMCRVTMRSPARISNLMASTLTLTCRFEVAVPHPIHL